MKVKLKVISLILFFVATNAYALDNNKEELKIKTPVNEDSCFKDAYEIITQMDLILDKEKGHTLFEKVKKSSYWNSLNEVNKEKLAKNVIKWTLEGDDKIKEVKSKMAEYYIQKCKNLK